jgi:hypothetical protein
MKYLLLLFSFISAHSLVAQELPGLVVHWKMNSNCELTDESEESPSNGALIDVSLAQDRNNNANAALSFNLNSSYIALGVVEKLKLAEDKSISFWINPVLSGSNRTGSVFRYGTGIVIRYEEQSAVARLNIIFGNTSYMQVNLTPGQWQLVTITFQKNFNTTKSKTITYINGAQSASSEQNKSAHDFNDSIALIGPVNQSVLTNGFSGRLDDMRIYDRALTAAEVLNIAVPAKLQFFRAKRIKNGATELSWKTILEDNVSYFYLQRSLDGIYFQKIKKVYAGEYNYQSYDLSDIPSLMKWYRLQIVDNDGRTEVSNVVWVSANDSLQNSTLKLFPNPVTEYINLVGVPDKGSLTIINSSGAIVKQEQYLTRNAVSVSDLTPGLYYVIFFDGRKRMTSKFIKR